MVFIWVSYNGLTATSLEMMVSRGDYPQMALIQVFEIFEFTQMMGSDTQSELLDFEILLTMAHMKKYEKKCKLPFSWVEQSKWSGEVMEILRKQTDFLD